jgi:competence protein ComEC
VTGPQSESHSSKAAVLWSTHDVGMFLAAVGLVLLARVGPFLLAYSQRNALLWAAALLITGSVVAGVWRLANRRTLFVVILMIAVVPGLSVRALAGLSPGTVGPVRSVAAVVVSDPEVLPTGDGQQAIVRVDGKLLRAVARGASARSLAATSAGTKVRIDATVSEWAGEIPPWAIARHLAGKASLRNVVVVDGGQPWWRLSGWVRNTIGRGARGLPPAQRPLFLGFVMGDDRGQTAGVTDDFRASGLSHLLVVSGQNVAFLLVTVQPLLRRMPPSIRILSALAVIAGFAVLTRGEPSVLRASAMAALAVTGRHLGRPQSGLRLVSLAVIGLLLIDPLLAWSVGFGLSVGATLGLSLLSEPIERRLWGPSWLRAPLAATVAAQLGTFPLLLGFGGVSPWSLVANLLALPAAQPVMVWGVVIGVPAGLLGTDAATALHLPNRVFIGWIALVARVVGAVVRTLPMPWWWPAPVLIIVLCLPLLRSRSVKRRASGVTVSALCGVLLLTASRGPVFSTAPVPLGRTPSALWATPEAAVLVFRSGSAPAAVLSALRALRVSRLDAVVVVQPSRTGWTQLGAITDRYNAPVVWCGQRVSDSRDNQVILGSEDELFLGRGSGSESVLVVGCVRGRAHIRERKRGIG